MERDTDLLIAGGGLAGGLIALALAHARPDLAVTIIEREPVLGGNHIWSFFDSDLDAEGLALVAPLICHRWGGTEVRFPGHARRLGGAYNSILSDRFDAVLRRALPADRLLAGRVIAALDPAGATLEDGTRIAARGVIDARGAAGALGALDLGWQKFAGRLLTLDAPHGLDVPTIMDATVAQIDGYRFVYLLPFGPRDVFVEDTYYSDTPTLDPAAIDVRIEAYAAARGWTVIGRGRQEAAALPIAMGGNFDALWGDGLIGKVGMAAGRFQPMTGYSLPDGVATATGIARLMDLSSPKLARHLRIEAETAWRQRGFYRLLARMLFRAATPDARWRILERFYRLDEGVIGRFYAARSTALDKARILIGKPPVPIGRALAVMKDAA